MSALSNLLACGYLALSLFLLQPAIGASLLLLIHGSAGGQWDQKFLSELRRLARFTPAASGLFALNFIFASSIYPWISHPEILRPHSQPIWLNSWFFVARGLVILALFVWVSVVARRESTSRALHCFGLIVLFFSSTIAMFDWVESLDPKWTSTIFGLIFLDGAFVSAMAFSFFKAAQREPASPFVKGNLFLTGCCVWAYCTFSQILILWMGHLPDHVRWIYTRAEGVWKPLTFAMWTLQFLIPFFVLLFRKLKVNPRILIALAVGVLIARWLEMTNWIFPVLQTSTRDLAMLFAGATAVAFILSGALILSGRRAAP